MDLGWCRRQLWGCSHGNLTPPVVHALLRADPRSNVNMGALAILQQPPRTAKGLSALQANLHEWSTGHVRSSHIAALRYELN